MKCRDYNSGEREAEETEKKGIGSVLINNIIEQLFGKNVKTKLLYRASKDGNYPKAFHSKCDNQGPTLVIIRAYNDEIAGGYAHLSWDSVSGHKGDDIGYKSFLFTINREKGIAYKFLHNGHSWSATFNNANYGPVFGDVSGSHKWDYRDPMPSGDLVVWPPGMSSYATRTVYQKHPYGLFQDGRYYFDVKEMVVLGIELSEQKITVYHDANYTGPSIELGIGTYPQSFLEIKGFNNQISSIKVPNGLRAVVYEENNRGGRTNTFTSNTDWVGDFNDKISHIEVFNA
jgi:hypothetical protein